MNNFKITFANDDYFITGFNGSFEDAVKYYLDNLFNMGTGESDNMQKCVKVEREYECRFTGRFHGAIGKFYPFTINVWADSVENARLKIYDTHQDLMNVMIKENNS